MATVRAVVTASLLVVACTNGDPAQRPDPLAPLPIPAPADTERFRDAETCAQCHLAPDDSPVLHASDGENVSPVLLWRSSMMGLAARDPYYLAVVAEEIARAPDREAETSKLCLRCHAPAGSEESNGALTFEELVSGNTPAAILGRGGVTCTLCHQIPAANLGEETSFSGGFSIGYGRMIFGRYLDPRTSPMMLIVNYTPTGGAHVGSAALCGSCHTVIVLTASGQVVEQATFLEWRSSTFATQNKPCQLCHVPVVDDQGVAISAPVAMVPAGLAPRTPVGKHVFVGGNSYILSLLADAVDWVGAGISRDELLASAARDEAHLATAAELSVVDMHREGGDAVVTIRVVNKTGHKLPTGYPSRRMWLHVTASTGGQVVFESGRVDSLKAETHHDQISNPADAQIWESILVDASGNPTHRALDARRYSKDNRILPAGFAPTSTSDKQRTLPVGTDFDTNFIGGQDDITYRIAGAPANLSLDVELLYQALRPELIDVIDRGNTPASSRFVDMARKKPITPVVMATSTATVP